MARWTLLQQHLASVEQEAHLSWDELDGLVGGLPASASTHRAWWSGDRPHVRAWKAAGFSIADLQMGSEVTFVRTSGLDEPPSASGPVTRTAATGTHVPAARKFRSDSEAADLILVTCVKSKLRHPAPARDLYTSPLFRKQRMYAEASGVPWFILSAEHGLVLPGEWLSPYERYLPDTPRSYRQAWGGWVGARLTLHAGPLKDKVIEVHASAAYVDAVGSAPLGGGL